MEKAKAEGSEKGIENALDGKGRNLIGRERGVNRLWQSQGRKTARRT